MFCVSVRLCVCLCACISKTRVLMTPHRSTPKTVHTVLSSEESLDFVSIDVFQGSKLLNQSLVLIFEHGHAIFEAFDIFLLLSSTLPGGFPGSNNNSYREKEASASWLFSQIQQRTQSSHKSVCTKGKRGLALKNLQKVSSCGQRMFRWRWLWTCLGH